MKERPQAFVIMPFEVEFDSIYETLIKKSLEEAGYAVTRADSFLDQHNILSDVINGITTADLVVADLTTNNPNVFYELGLCHALGVPTALIAQSINDVPFDLRSYKIQIYETHFNKVPKLKKFLKDLGQKHLSKEITFTSPVSDFSADNKKTILENQLAVTEQLLESIEPVDEKELLDYLVEGDKATHDLTSILTKLLKDNELITRRITRHATSMQMLSDSPTAGSASRYHKVSLLAASDMNSFSKKVEDILPRFEETIDRLDENYSGFVSNAEPQSQDKEGLKRFRASIQGLLDGAKDAGSGMRAYRDAVLGLGERKLSKDLSRASRRQAEALNGILSNMQRVEAFSFKTLTMLDAKFGKDAA